MRIVIAENDVPLAEFIKEQLESEHWRVDLAGSDSELEFQLQANAYGLAIIDLGLPTKEGLDLLRRIRAGSPDLLVLILSVSGDPETHFNCLDAGADDFITKPFYSSVLLARLRALLRRRNHSSNTILKVEDVELDRVRRTVKRNGCAIDLTQKEFALLEILMERPLQPVSRATISKDAWNLRDGDKMTNTVDVYINYLRKKIDFDDDHPLIRTVRGVGYQIGGAGTNNREKCAANS